MKTKVETKKKVKLDKKPGNLIKIYDLYFQITEGLL